MAESLMARAARLLMDAAASAQAGEAEEALITANEAVYALRKEMGELPEDDQ